MFRKGTTHKLKPTLGKEVYSQLGNMHWKVDEHLKYLINFPERNIPWKYKIFQLYSDVENFLVSLIFS